ncbi:MAG: CYTH domain-containing protein [Phascolarctobacterium sp.]
MAKNTEIELKLLVSKDSMKAFMSLPCIGGAIREGSCQKRRLVSSYYDTEDLAFKRQGIAYRVRSKGDGTYEATVKTRIANGAGLSERVELNLPLNSPRPKLDGFAELGLATDLKELAPNGVSKLFTVTVQRTTYILDLEGAVAELAVDKGKITAGTAVDKIDEVEIELLEGDKGALLELAANIAAKVTVFVEKRSKFARGLALRGISVDAAPEQDKLGTGPIKNELLAAVATHGDQLMALKKPMLENISEKNLKVLRRELLALRCLAALGGVEGCEELVDTIGLVERARRLVDLQALWQDLQVKAGMPLRTSLQKKLSEATLENMALLQIYAGSGRFTSIVFDLTNKLYQAELAEATVESRVKSSLKEWQQVISQKAPSADAEAGAAEDQCSVEAKVTLDQLATVEKICALARCCNVKAVAKAAEAVKKQRRQLSKQAALTAWRELLDEFLENSTSKNLYREAGMVMGYLLAKK